MKKIKSILNKDFLKAHLTYFPLSKIDGLELKREILKDWIQSYKSGKLKSQNETAIGADFINDIFGNVLGFNYRNSSEWNLEKELKTFVDGKKPDGAIGYFNLEKEMNNSVQGVIELKDAKTNLDKPQKRSNDKRTPVEQAFSYAPKFGEKCRWIIVSNFIEIRLYHRNDESRYEVFQLENLQKESELKRFFFLLQKERLISKIGTPRIGKLIKKNDEANTLKIKDSSSHILDKIHTLLVKFDGLAYINPNIIANASPFNNSNEYVWHYSKFSLQSTEEGIFDFFKEIKVENQHSIISNKLKKELEDKGVVEYQAKVDYIIKRLNDCLVLSIECYEDLNKVKEFINRDNVIGGSLRDGMNNYANQLKKFSIDCREHGKVCNCLRCCYQRLDFTNVLKRLKSREGNSQYYTLETGYFHHIFGTNNFKTSLLIYKEITKRENTNNEFLYFIAKKNLLSLHNLIEREYDLDDKNNLMDEINTIDLDLMLHELDVIDPDKRKLLIEIKEGTIRSKTEKKIEIKTAELKKVKDSFERGSRGQFPNYTFPLTQALASFLFHYSQNFILGNAFTNYKSICEKILKAYLISYSIHEGYYARLKKFDTLHINLVIFDIFPNRVEKMFKDCDIKEIILSEKAKKDLIVKTTNFLKSNHGEKIYFGTPHKNEHLAQAFNSFHFAQIYRHIFCNLFFLLNRIELSNQECKMFITPLINFLKVETPIFQASFKLLANFISRYGKYFESKELAEILKLNYEITNLNNDELVKAICFSLDEFHTKYKLSDRIVLQKAILKLRRIELLMKD